MFARQRSNTRRKRNKPPIARAADSLSTFGRIVWLGEGWRAEDPAGNLLGIFETKGEARDAILSKPARCECLTP